MPDITPQTCMFVRAAYFPSPMDLRHVIVSVPYISALVGHPRYRLDDPRIRHAPARPTGPRRGRPPGPTAATIAKMWTESQGDRSVFHRKLEARLRRDGRLSPATNTAEIARILGERGIDAPLP